ncbi:MAG: zinc ribbon domain-containing protein [Planctomycetes bacterium]|nr:zinc ribbon domain-containing protein [Planctomycetota bacterium]
MTRYISPERKAGYYVGFVLMVLGVIIFMSTFFTHAMQLAVVGIVIAAIGQIIQRVSARGLRGSGVILDPEGARDDLEPYTRMAGGMVKDALDEADISLGRSAPGKVVMIRCQDCGTLNEEDSKFCQECGRKL